MSVTHPVPTVGNDNNGTNATGVELDRAIDDVPLIVNNGKPTNAFVTTLYDVIDVAPKKFVTVTPNVYVTPDVNNDDGTVMVDNELDDDECNNDCIADTSTDAETFHE